MSSTIDIIFTAARLSVTVAVAYVFVQLGSSGWRASQTSKACRDAECEGLGGNVELARRCLMPNGADGVELDV